MSANDGKVCQGWKIMHCIALTSAQHLAAVVRDMRSSVIPMMPIRGYMPVCTCISHDFQYTMYI